MFKTLVIALLPLMAAQGAFAEATLASAQVAPMPHAQIQASCEGPGALARNVEPCASYWQQVQTEMTACMGKDAMSGPAFRARFLTCRSTFDAKYLAVSQ